VPFRLLGELDETPLCIALREGSNRIGSAADCEVCLPHTTVSRVHAELIVSGDQAELLDLGSRNGTFFGSRRVSRQKVSAGAALAFGRVNVVLQWVAEADLEVGLALNPSPLAAPAGEAAAALSTVGFRAVDRFVFDQLPGLLAALAAGERLEAFAGTLGAALFDVLPVTLLEVLDQPALPDADPEPGVLFQATRDAPALADPAEVRQGGGGVAVRAVFPHARAARTFEPLVRIASTLLLLARQPGPPIPISALAALAPESPREPLPPAPASASPQVRRIYAEAARVARGDVGVLLCGESGTGKELLAHYVHAASSRAGGPFVALNCAALPQDLLEAELFGVERGVATGVEQRPGKLELAHGGTLLLDEIGDMAPKTQAALLRALQERQVFRVGGATPRAADARVIAATNKDLHALMAAGEFRRDLYYRIATWVAELPPLRRRRADIPNLAAHFLSRQAAASGLRPRGLSRAAVSALIAYTWPGNIRQLENEMARAVLFLADGALLEARHLSPHVQNAQSGQSAQGVHQGAASLPSGSLAAALAQCERDEIILALAAAGGDVAGAAAALGVGRSTLYRRLKDLAIEPLAVPPAGPEPSRRQD
jgi:two-component system response regulator FlrC